MSDNRRVWLSILTRTFVSVALIVTSVVIFSVLFITREKPGAAQAVGSAPRVAVVRTQPVSVRQSYDGFGVARAMDTADVPARVASTVLEIPDHIKPGQYVDRGELLAKLDESDFRNARDVAQENIAELDTRLARLAVEEQAWTNRLALAQDDVALAEAEYGRVVEAKNRDAAKQRELDLARQAVIAATRAEVATREELDKIPTRRLGLEALKRGQEAASKQAALDLERSTITSPIEGVLEAVDVEPGESVMPGQRIARLVDVRKIEVPIRLPASARRDLALGDRVHLRATGTGLSQWTGAISRISPADDASTRTVSVFVEIEQQRDAPDVLAPGRFVRGVVESGTLQVRTVVPRRAVRDERIKVVENDVVTSRPVQVEFHVLGDFPELGVDVRQWAVLREPLPEGTLVVIDAGVSATDGDAVTPVPASASGLASRAESIEPGASQ